MNEQKPMTRQYYTATSYPNTISYSNLYNYNKMHYSFFSFQTETWCNGNFKTKNLLLIIILSSFKEVKLWKWKIGKNCRNRRKLSDFHVANEGPDPVLGEVKSEAGTAVEEEETFLDRRENAYAERRQRISQYCQAQDPTFSRTVPPNNLIYNQV